MSIRYTVIIPVYNVASYLRDCLDSVLAQTYVEWEAICIDDGSTDMSGAILDTYAKKDMRITVVHQINGGVSAARNKALNLARGEWILFVDGDDVLEKDTLSKVNHAVTGCVDAELIAFGVAQFSEWEQPNWEGRSEAAVELIDCRSNFDEMKCSLFAVWGKAFKRESLSAIRFSPFRISEDFLFMCQYACCVRYVAIVAQKCYGYRQRATSVMHEGFDGDKVRDVMNANAEAIRIITRNPQKFSKRIKRLTASQLFEMTLARVSILGCEVRTQILLELSRYVKEFRSTIVIPLDIRIRLWICVLCAYRSWAMRLFILDMWRAKNKLRDIRK